MITHKDRILAVARGEMADVWPYVPRIDLWYNANLRAGTLPKEHQGRTLDEICRAEGWAAHHLVPTFIRDGRQQVHRALGLYDLREQPFKVNFAKDVEIEVIEDGDFTTVKYHTPKGTVSTRTMYSEEMRASGASITWVAEHVLKTAEDYDVAAYIFETLTLTPNYEEFGRWLNDEVGVHGIGAAFASLASSPVHHIQKEFLDATDFYYHYHDNAAQMRRLAEAVGNYYDQAMKLIAESPAEAVLWGANFDDMITYATYFEKEISPWIRKAGHMLRDHGKITICHCDGENFGLMDVLPEAGFDVAEAVCPWPMTKVKIEEYYRRWHDRLTIFGGIPSNILLDDCAGDQEFEDYLDNMLKTLTPGDRLIVGIADTTPPQANWDRLRRLGDRIGQEARLPLKSDHVFVSGVDAAKSGASPAQAGEAGADEVYAELQRLVIEGDDEEIGAEVQKLLKAGVPARDIMSKGLVSAMDIIGPQFRDNLIFIPEVLLSARAMNKAVEILEPHLKGKDAGEQKTVVIGTVFGDLHDIGKNMVGTMLKGAGFQVVDLGINVKDHEFVEAVKKHKPQVLGLSALLTTTMPEMQKAIATITESGLRGEVKIMVGGAPVNAKFASDIGADGYSADAGEAVDLARSLTA